MINAIGNILGGGSARISYAKKLAKAYAARVIADGGVVESLGCFTAFAKALGAFKPTLLLDFYQNAAAAYSLRKLSTTYTGDAIRVRRASDNTELNIAFVNNVLDTASLTTFCSGTDGFVKTWYDQSGNDYDATQITAANQPQIVSSGSVILENGKPSINFNVSQMILDVTRFSYSEISSIAVLKCVSTPSSNAHVIAQKDGFLLKAAQAPNGYPRFQPYDTAYRTSEYQVTSTNTQLLLFGYTSSGTAYIYVNDNVGTTASVSTLNNPSNAIHIGSFPGLSDTHNNGPIQEVIIYPSDQSTNRTGIESNINSFYSIY